MWYQRNRHCTWLLAAFVLALGWAGCGDESQTPVNPNPPPPEIYDLNAPNGGFTTEPESPAFGDQDLIRSQAEEREMEDPIENEPDVREWFASPMSNAYAFTALWGNLEDISGGGSEKLSPVSTDWSGSAELSRGALLLRSLVSFEAGDSLVRRQNRHSIAWVSETDGGFDGIRLVLVFPPHDPGNLDAADSLTFTAGEYERVLLAEELDGLDEIVTVDAEGNAVSLSAFRLDPTVASFGGFLRGRWASIAAGDSVGHFKGLWIGHRGRPIGHFRGIYGTRSSDGEKVFFGKYVDLNGNFLGILRGHWDQAEMPNGPTEVASGGFRGEWLNADETRLGQLHGRWRSFEGRPGFLAGRWCQVCNLRIL